MKLIFALAMLLTLSFAASAAPENYTNGPYKFSFDMNTTLNHTVEIQNPVDLGAAIEYPLLIKTNDNESAQIIVAEFNNLTDSTTVTQQQLGMKDMALLGFNYNNSLQISQNLTIDKNKGFALMGRNSKGKQLMLTLYWLDSKNCQCGPDSVAKTKVGITSTYLIDITFWLISSLHVEKNMNASAKKLPLTFKPPSF